MDAERRIGRRPTDGSDQSVGVPALPMRSLHTLRRSSVSWTKERTNEEWKVELWTNGRRAKGCSGISEIGERVLRQRVVFGVCMCRSVSRSVTAQWNSSRERFATVETKFNLKSETAIQHRLTMPAIPWKSARRRHGRWRSNICIIQWPIRRAGIQKAAKKNFDLHTAN